MVERTITRANGRSITGSPTGIVYSRPELLDGLRRADIALDKDGVFTHDCRLMHFSRKAGFDEFGSKLSRKGQEVDGYVYTIDEDIGAKLGTVRGYNTGSAPVEIIIAVNRLVRSEQPMHGTITLDEFRGNPAGAFRHLLSYENPADLLDGIRASHLDDKDRAAALEIFNWYDQKVYKHPDMAKHMIEIPGSTAAVMALYRHCTSNGKRLSVVTDTPNRDTFYRHLSAVGFDTGMIRELEQGLMVVTRGDVLPEHRKPHHEGLARVKREEMPILYVGDTPRDGETVKNAKTNGNIPDVHFGAVLSGGSKLDAFHAYEPAFIAKDLSTVAREIIRV